MTTLNDHDRAVALLNDLWAYGSRIREHGVSHGYDAAITDLRELVSHYIARPQAPKDAVLYSPEITISVDVAVSPWGTCLVDQDAALRTVREAAIEGVRNMKEHQKALARDAAEGL